MKLSAKTISIILGALITASGFLVGLGMIKGKLESKENCIEQTEKLKDEITTVKLEYFKLAARTGHLDKD